MQMVTNHCKLTHLGVLTFLIVRLAGFPCLCQAAEVETSPLELATPEIANTLRRTNSTYEFTARVWQTDEGLPHNMVRGIAQTTDGYLWVGTRAGLARFDGLRFTAFNPKNTPAMKAPSVGALCVDRDGAFWTGFLGGGLLRLQNGVFSQYDATNGVVGGDINVLYAGRDGSLWIGANGGRADSRR